jgi:C-terminal processing protease CtpA/Prc
MRLFFIACITIIASASTLTAATFGGVGIDGVPTAEGTILVRQVVTGGPAHLAGIQPGDVITHVDGIATTKENFYQLVAQRLRGPVGTTVTVTVQRQPRANALQFTLTRRQLITKDK